jgi:hypothetical protein
MFIPIENGSCINIQGLDCWIPKEGYVLNVETQKYEYRGVQSRSDDPKEQKWERKPLPSWYKDTLKKWKAYDKKKTEDDPEFYDEQLEAYKKQEWDRRLNGYWFMNNGKAVYLTGSHYMYLQWWQIDIGYPKYRITDLEYFYFQQYVVEDPDCMGMLEITKRRFGKTFRGGLFLYEYITRTKMTNGAIQSKTGMDAKKVFGKAVISPFKKLPKFFRPEYDMSLGITPKTEIRFQQTNIRGSKAEDGLDKEELGSMIDHGSADPIHYDGQKIHRGFEDEWAKTIECNIYDRHEVLRYCVVDDEGNIIGKLLYSSTVEKLDTDREGIQESAKTLWDDSDQLNKGENGRTASGLYRFFMTADRSKNFDEYGYPDEEKTVREILADRETVKHNQRSLTKRIKKEARTIEEAFSDDGEKCIFNIENINQREKQLFETPKVMRKIIFWMDEEKQKVRWRDIQRGEQDFCWHLSEDAQLGLFEDNKVIQDGNILKPGRTKFGAISVDSYSNSQGGKKYGSKASAWIGRKRELDNPDKSNKAVGHLFGRPKEKDDLHKQVMLAAIYLGYQVWFEHNSDSYDSYFRDRGKRAYLGLYPLNCIEPLKREDTERHRGVPTTPYSLTTQHDNGIAYFENYCHLIDFLEVLGGAKKFDPYDRTKSDAVVSFLILITVMSEPDNTPPPLKTPLIRVYPNYTAMASGGNVRLN